MGRPCTTWKGKRRKQHKRVAVAYGDKKTMPDYLDKGNTVKECITHFHGELPRKEHRVKEKIISKWRKAASSVQAACESGRSRHLKMCQLGDGTVLTRNAEEEIAQWINTFRKEGAPMSRFCCRRRQKTSPRERGVGHDLFSSSATWMKLFMKRHRLTLRTRTRQGQTTHQDAAKAAQFLERWFFRPPRKNNYSQNI